jgi:hypothetical protein
MGSFLEHGVCLVELLVEPNMAIDATTSSYFGQH